MSYKTASRESGQMAYGNINQSRNKCRIREPAWNHLAKKCLFLLPIFAQVYHAGYGLSNLPRIFLKACFLKLFAQILILNLDFERYNQSNEMTRIVPRELDEHRRRVYEFERKSTCCD